MNVPESWGWIGGPIARATPRIIGLFVGLALMRGADVGVWFYLGIAVLVLSLPLANPGAWLRYVRTGSTQRRATSVWTFKRLVLAPSR
jgi:hypothetical protein